MRERELIIGVSGGIAAYKTAVLVSQAVQAGAGVQVVMTRSAEKFIGPATFQALTGRPVARRLFDEAHPLGSASFVDPRDGQRKNRYLDYEALERALRLGRDQGFVSASFRQTSQIRKFVKQHAREYFGLALRGTEVVRLPNGAELHFFAANPAVRPTLGPSFAPDLAELERWSAAAPGTSPGRRVSSTRRRIGSIPRGAGSSTSRDWRNSPPIPRVRPS